MMMISTDGWRGTHRLFGQLNSVWSTRLDLATHQALYSIEYKDITRLQVNACQRISVPRHATAQRRTPHAIPWYSWAECAGHNRSCAAAIYGASMKLFMFYVGGNCGNSNIELHDVRFSMGNAPEDCYDDLRRQWWGDPTSLHLALIHKAAIACVAAGRGAAEPDITARTAWFLLAGISLPGTLRIEQMKLSARNVLPGKDVAVAKGATTAHVKVELASGLTVMSSITNEAVDDLALKIGDSVSAVIKSSDVMIGK
jgi:molybdopterin-binding protein